MEQRANHLAVSGSLVLYQVPALTGPKLSAPLTDSVDISYWLCGHYPNLLPPDLEPTIKDLFTKLHDIEIYSLSARPESVLPEWQTSGVPPTSVDALLAKPDSEISPKYRKALEKKRELYAFRALFYGVHVADFRILAKSGRRRML